MKSTRNLIILFLGFVLMFGASIFFGCSDDGGGGGGSANVPVTGVTLDKTGISVSVGSTEQLTATIEPAEATNQNVTWASIDDSVASVSETGLVTAVAAGAVAITVTTEDGHYTAVCTVTTDWTVGNKVTFTADSVSFVMAYVPAKIFPVGLDDNGDIEATNNLPSPATVPNAYWTGETEVTYELWSAVYSWAIANEYFFENTGIIGSSGSGSTKQPVTTINWRDTMVWCNAATEWYNEKKGTGYTCVYTYLSAIIRDSRDSNASECDGALENLSATGFRLLTSNEWELAARWRNDATNTVNGYSNPWFTQGDSASAATADYNDEDATRKVAWYSGDPGGDFTHEVGKKIANALGLYDMSGNVMEWCFDWHPDYIGSSRVLRGGSYTQIYHLQVGCWSWAAPSYMWDNIGFRIARTE